ncbi:MAG: imidazoleglycerol-phosphate dehydratase HisB [Fimbriimonadales bacterium]|nr:imidazoleglycerol-phosphate dehydratase HisB [Fimbriimonadales bacterium]
MSQSAKGVRFAELYRETKETRVSVVVDLDGGSKQDVSTGIGFLDHMLALLAFHGRLDVGIDAEGDLHVDDHHTAEDVGIVLGRAIRDALQDSDPIERFGEALVPMDEALVQIALDFSGRGMLFFHHDFRRERVGELSTECVREFLRAVAAHGGITLHVRVLAGENDHHVIEAVFKGVGLALHRATRRSDRPGSTSTKGTID